MNLALPLYAALPTPEEMRQWDNAAQSRFGIPPLLLMENAGREAFAVLKKHVNLDAHTRVLVIMGGGNNGGDGAAIARYLHDAGCKVLVHHATKLKDLRSPAKEHVAMAQNVGVNFLPLGPGDSLTLPLEWHAPTLIVDAVTGTGIRGDLRERELALVEAINARRKHSFIFSLDIPSGLCGYTGKPRPEAVHANLTVTFESGKPGLFFPEAQEFTGRVVVRRVGIPVGVRAMVPPSWQLLDPEKGSWAAPSVMRHKGEAGKVLVIGGSEGMAGAPVLAALGSLHAGAGLVHMACPAGLATTMHASWPEILVHGIGAHCAWEEQDVQELLSLMRSIQPGAIVLGPGMGRTPAVRSIVKAVLEEKKRPSVIVDADALHFFRLPDYRPEYRDAALERQEEQGLPLDLLAEKDILTPHPGEMAKMLPCSFFTNSSGIRGKEESKVLHACINELQEDRNGVLRAFTRVCAAVLVLKGPGTLIGQQSAPTTLSPFAVSTLAVGGSGDVLAGVCAAVTASGVLPLDAACLGVYLHGKAGELLAQQSLRGHLARDIANAIPLAWNSLCNP